MHAAKTPTLQSRRRMLRFRLRTLLILVAVTAVGLAIYGNLWRGRQRQHALAAELSKLGIRARSFDQQPTFGIPPAIHYVEIDGYLGMKTDGRAWQAVPRSKRDRLTADQVRRLGEFPELRKLTLVDDVIEPDALATIAELPSLEELMIGHFPLTDAQMLRFVKLPRLRELTLEATDVTDDGIDQLRSLRPGLQVFDD